MRGLIIGALNGAREVVRSVVDNVRDGNKLTSDELVQRYLSQHRGRPIETAAFVMQNAPKGSNPLVEWRRYEAAMEAELRKRGL